MRKAAATTVALLVAVLIAACGGTHHPQAATGSAHPAGWGKPIPSLLHKFGATAPVAHGTMYDSIDLSTVPSNPFAQAGYTAGHWPTYLPMRRAWPKSHTISIAISAGFHADCLDVEPGDAVPSQAPGWVRADITHGFPHPCVYSSLWEYVNQVRPALTAAHIPRSDVFEWDADYRGCNGTIDAGFDATQCTDRALGRNLDQSVVTLAFLSIAQPPYKPPAPRPVCFGTGQNHVKVCLAVVAKVNRERAHLRNERRYRTSLLAVLKRHHCRTPYRRYVCRVAGRFSSVTLGQEKALEHEIASTVRRYS